MVQEANFTHTYRNGAACPGAHGQGRVIVECAANDGSAIAQRGDAVVTMKRLALRLWGIYVKCSITTAMTSKYRRLGEVGAS